MNLMSTVNLRHLKQVQAGDGNMHTLHNTNLVFSLHYLLYFFLNMIWYNHRMYSMFVPIYLISYCIKLK